MIEKLLTHHTELDWQSYFEDFAREHGGSPMLWQTETRGDWLIFGDGWSYALESHEGPERPPPEDVAERCNFLRFYWRRRRHAVVTEMKQIENDLAGFEALKSSHSLPLKTRSTWWDADARAWRQERGQALNLEAMRDRMDWLQNDLLACENKLLEIELEAKGGSCQSAATIAEPG